MNELNEKIVARRSIRKYQPQQIPTDIVEEILTVAMSAPTAHNQQPWRFVVIDDAEELHFIPTFKLYANMLYKCPLAIIVCCDFDSLKRDIYWQQDCAAATENILLAANNLGLGATWLGLYPDEAYLGKMSELLALPENIMPFSIVALGYPREEKEPALRYDAAKVHWNKWNQGK